MTLPVCFRWKEAVDGEVITKVWPAGRLKDSRAHHGAGGTSVEDIRISGLVDRDVVACSPRKREQSFLTSSPTSILALILPGHICVDMCVCTVDENFMW